MEEKEMKLKITNKNTGEVIYGDYTESNLKSTEFLPRYIYIVEIIQDETQ